MSGTAYPGPVTALASAGGGEFGALSPAIAMEAVEAAYGIRLDGSIMPYSSYVNRVYGIRDDDGADYVVKFYRPGRWSSAAILEEHRFILDCREAELPVVTPLPDAEGSTLAEFELDAAGAPGAEGAGFMFALFPKRGGRGFDAEREEDWRRLGSLAGRLHATGRTRIAALRPKIGGALATANLGIVAPLVHPEFRNEFAELCAETIATAGPALDAMPSQRIHGDLHRGNILDRPGEGLLLIDFDDMAMGPPVQDLWLLLPGRTSESGRELSLLIEGYSEFSDLEAGSVGLIETLRFFRMLHFLAWRARQRADAWFARDFPDWGGRAFWIRELEDMRDQAKVVSA